jgi:cobalt/nickel transport system permease protein
MWSLIDHHLDVDSPLRTWHATTKLIGIGSLIAATACVTNASLAGAALALSVVAVVLTRLPVRPVIRRTRGLIAFIALFTVLVALTAHGRPVFSLGPIGVSAHGLELAAVVGAKAVGITLLALALVATTPFAQLCRSLNRIGCPARLVSVILLSYRMNFALGGEMESVRAALAARGFRFRFSRRALGTIGLVIGSLLVRSLERADRLYNGMLARGYDGNIPYLSSQSVAGADVLKMLAAIVLAGALVGVQLWI